MPTMQDLSKFKSANDIAVELGVHKATINRIAKDHELGTKFGATEMRVFTKAEVQQIHRLCHLKKGNPNFSKKN
jgi:DNA-directed RNA polymerase specialized sigma54-like protein